MLDVDRPMVSGIYANSLGTGLNAWNADNKSLRLGDLETEITTVHKIGLGACMIRREVFEELAQKVSRPWFQFIVDDKHLTAEDFYFCHLARTVGFHPVIDRRISLLHIKAMQVNTDLTAE